MWVDSPNFATENNNEKIIIITKKLIMGRLNKTKIAIMALFFLPFMCSCSSNDDWVEEKELPYDSRLMLTVFLKGAELSDWANSRAYDDEHLRGVVEMYKTSEPNKLLVHKEYELLGIGNGAFCFDVDSLPEGEMNCYVWLDKGYYQADDLKHIQIDDNYDVDRDKRKAYYGHSRMFLKKGDGNVATGTVASPFVGYRIEALDVQKYNEIRMEKGWPEISKLQVQVVYPGFFPTGFNVITEKPNDAKRGVKFSMDMSRLGQDEKVILVSDYIFSNGNEMNFPLTVKLVDSQSGKVISEVNIQKLTCKSGYNTVVSGDFLTAGDANGGVEIDTKWEGSYDIEF